MKKRTTFNFRNATKANHGIVLWAFGLAEGIVMILQTAEWLQDYVWWPRILPIMAFAMSHTKILFNQEIVGAPQEVVLKSDTPIEVEEKEKEG